MTEKENIIKRTINPDISMSDGTFGISLHFGEKMKNPVYVEAMLVQVEDKEGNIIEQFRLLTHQLYLHKLKDISKNGKYNVFVTPIFPEQERISVFEVEEQENEDE